MVFDHDEHVYFVDGERVRNVTGITDSLDLGKTNALMGWAVKVGMEKLRGDLVPSGLRADDLFSVSPEVFDAAIKEAKKAHRQKKEGAATIGRDAHDWVEAHIKAQIEFGPDPDPPRFPESQSAVDAYLSWEREHHVQYLQSERKIYSRLHQYAGTLDIIAIVDGKRSLIDLKTSNSPRIEYFLQTAAYAFAWEEEMPDEPLEDRFILMLGKTKASFDVVERGVESVARDMKAFMACKVVAGWVDEETRKRGGDSA